MTASATDKFRKGVAQWSGNIGSAGVADAVVTTIPLASASNLPTDTAVMITVNRVDTNGVKTGNYEGIVGVVSGNNLINCIRGVEGTAQAWTGGTVVEILHTASNMNELVDGLLVEHGQDGKHTSDLVTTLKATGAEINTGTEDGKIVTPKAIADSYLSNGYNSLARQAIINGNFDVWQRGTSVAMTAANSYTADRWYCETATAGTDKTVSREDGTGVNGSLYCARVKMVSDVDELLTFSQALESQDSIKFRGKKLTLSFYARAGAEFVADNPTLVSKIVTGKGTDQKVLAFTTSADGVSQNNTLTTGWQKFTCTTTAAIASDITQIGVSFAFTHAGSGTTTNYFEVTQVQLCAGDVALPFMPKSFEEELRACQRYCFVPDCTSASSPIAQGVAVSTTIGPVRLKLPVTMRITPTITATATDFVLADGANAAIDLTSIALFTSTKDTVEIDARVSSGLTQYRVYQLLSDGTAGRILVLSSEL